MPRMSTILKMQTWSCYCPLKNSPMDYHYPNELYVIDLVHVSNFASHQTPTHPLFILCFKRIIFYFLNISLCQSFAQGHPTFKEWSNTGYKNTPPSLYSGWHWKETPDSEPLWGLPVASTAMCSQINFSLCFHLPSTDVVPSNYAHIFPIGVSFPGNSI